MYRYLADGTIKAVQFKAKTLVRRKEIDTLFDNPSSYHKKLPNKKSPITEFYTTAEIKEKYNITESWIFEVAKKERIPKTSSRGRTY